VREIFLLFIYFGKKTMKRLVPLVQLSPLTGNFDIKDIDPERRGAMPPIPGT